MQLLHNSQLSIYRLRCTCRHRITMSPPDHDIATGSRYRHRITMSPRWELRITMSPPNHDVATMRGSGSGCRHRITMSPPDHDIATGSRYRHRITISPPDHDIATGSGCHHKRPGFLINTTHDTLDLPTRQSYTTLHLFPLHDNYYMRGSPSLVCAQISRASTDILHATPPDACSWSPIGLPSSAFNILPECKSPCSESHPIARIFHPDLPLNCPSILIDLPTNGIYNYEHYMLALRLALVQVM